MPEQLTKKQKSKVESFLKLGEDVIIGAVTIDRDKCIGCGYCTKCCAANCLEVKDKKARMIEVLPLCMSCGDCTAICPEGAITIETFIDFHYLFHYLDRGKPLAPRRF